MNEVSCLDAEVPSRNEQTFGLPTYWWLQPPTFLRPHKFQTRHSALSLSFLRWREASP